jgi:hypothetical protein
MYADACDIVRGSCDFEYSSLYISLSSPIRNVFRCNISSRRIVSTSPLHYLQRSRVGLLRSITDTSGGFKAPADSQSPFGF